MRAISNQFVPGLRRSGEQHRAAEQAGLYIGRAGCREDQGPACKGQETSIALLFTARLCYVARCCMGPMYCKSFNAMDCNTPKIPCD